METYQIVGVVILIILLLGVIVVLAYFAPRSKDGVPVKPISPLPHNDRQ